MLGMRRPRSSMAPAKIIAVAVTNVKPKQAYTKSVSVQPELYAARTSTEERLEDLKHNSVSQLELGICIV
ncbi:hypothetical protein KC356_g11 [Hortaea werneckii]|nr:hypothetical protein KC356_g11 [Hortaea werneckii]